MAKRKETIQPIVVIRKPLKSKDVVPLKNEVTRETSGSVKAKEVKTKEVEAKEVEGKKNRVKEKAGLLQFWYRCHFLWLSKGVG